MKAIYKDNTTKGPGYGIIVFTEALFPAAPWSISLQRSSDGNFLVKGGGKWVGESAFFPLEGALSEDGANLELYLEPPAVNSLDQQEQYRIILQGSDGEAQKARLKLNSITFSREDERNNTAQVRRKSEKAPVQEPPARKKPEEKKETFSPSPPLSSTPEEPAQTENLELSSPPPQQGTSRKSWILALLALLIAGAVLAFFLLNKSPDKAAEATQPSAAKKEEKRQLSAEEQVRNFFAQNSPTAQGALELAESLSKTSPEDQDAVYRLYYYAADNNDSKAFLPYGNCLNPALPKWGSISKNAVDAYEAYAKGRAANPEEAQKAMDDLLAWLEKQSADGNATAREWLAQIKKQGT